MTFESRPFAEVLALPPRNGIHKGPEYQGSGVPIVKMGEAYNSTLISSGAERDRFALSPTEIAKLQLEPDDLLACRTSLVPSGVGRMARVGVVSGNLAYASNLIRFRVNPAQADARYIQAFFESDLGRQRILSIARGTSVTTITGPDIAQLRIPLPDLPEQRRIAGVLGALDDLIDTNENLISDLDELSMSLFLDAWDGTSWCEIQDLGKLTMGQSPPGTSLSDEQDGLPFFQGVRDFGSRFPTQRIFTKDSKRQVREGAILIAVRAPVGEANVALTEVSIGRGLAGLEATDPAIAFQALRATSETWDAHQGTGTVFSSINGNELKKARVPLVRDDSLSQVLAVLDMQFKELFLENQQLRRTRDELLPLLMSGKIRVREAEELVKERVG